MKDLERVREEVVTILVLVLTLAFTSSNFPPEPSNNQSLSAKWLITEVTN